MHILLTGSTGFIGNTLQTALQRAGHTVHGGVSPRSRTLLPGQVPMDFAHDTTAAAWLPRLAGIDAVVNAVGVLRDTRARPIDAVHRDTPIALFDACAQAGVQRVVHISALGIDGSNTRYAQTKRAAEAHLQTLATQAKLRPAILRPSVVYGKGYPRGLTREQMSLQARMMGIADIFEALTAADRPYKSGMTLSQAIAIMCKMRDNGHIDPDLFEVFVRERVYLRYGEQFLEAGQVDAVDVTAMGF